MSLFSQSYKTNTLVRGRVIPKLGLGILIGWLVVGSLFAKEPIQTSQGYAISGYDTVAYFTEGKAVKGKSDYTFQWKEADWLFSTQEHLTLFKNNPERYAPQYGGHCAWGIGAKGGLYSVDPLAWSIVEDKLYLNYNSGIKNTWSRQTEKFIKKGDAVWAKILAKKKADS